MSRSRVTTAALLACGLLASGCALGGAASRAASSFFVAPRKVNRPANPVAKDARLAIVWIGHASVLLQIDDKLILTDPVFTTTVGQVSKRLYEPGIDPDTLPLVDAVLISHLHFDHLSLGSLSMIEKKVRTLILPTSGMTYLTDFDFPALELMPWQAWEKDGLRVTAVPVDHVGFRYGVDDAWMKTGFTGYVIDYHGIRVYFGGDTAYDQKDFVETGQRFPGIDLALVPIGPIEPRSIMRRFHLDPREAVQAFFDLNAKIMVPIHYGTFVNSTDAGHETLVELDAAKRTWTLGSREILPVAIGEQHVFLHTGEQPVKLAPPSLLPEPPPAVAKAKESDKDKEPEEKKEPDKKEPEKKAPDKKALDKKAPDKKAPDKKAPDKKAPDKKDAAKPAKPPPAKPAPKKGVPSDDDLESD